MIRANLLPRPKEHVRILGLSLDAEYFKETLAALLVTASVCALFGWVEFVRVRRLDADASRVERAIAAQSDQRRRVQALASELARLQSIERESRNLRRSGNDAALLIARTGNHFPPSTWLDSIASLKSGALRLSGEARDLGSLGSAADALERARPRGDSALLVDVARSQRGDFQFTILEQPVSKEPPDLSHSPSPAAP